MNALKSAPLIMIAKVVSIGDRRPDAITEPTPVVRPAPELAIERVRRALANWFDLLKPLKSKLAVERYLASDRRGKAVQLNVLAAHAASDVKARELFYHEAHCASKLAHMNILEVTTAEEVNGVDFCVVEHRQDAVTLSDLLNRNGWLDVKVAARISDQIASALHHAHQMGVLHLDLQSECVLVEPDGWVMIADFGVELERASRRLEDANAQYASRELAMGKMVDHRTDLYSLGAVLYEMLTDRTPFDSDDADYVKRKQMSFSPSPPHLISMDVPESVSNVVMKLLERDRVNRFASAAAFQKALDDAVN